VPGSPIDCAALTWTSRRPRSSGTRIRDDIQPPVGTRR